MVNSVEMLGSKLIGATEGVFFEDLVLGGDPGKEETTKMPIFNKGRKVGFITYSCTKTYVGVVPPSLNEIASRNKELVQEV